MTLWTTKVRALGLWEEHFEEFLGPLTLQSNGTRGFRRQYKALDAAKLLTDPFFSSQDTPSHVCFDFPGTSCEALPTGALLGFYSRVIDRMKTRFTRLDLCWDGVEISPINVRDAVLGGNIRSAAHRRTLSYYSQPLERNWLGKLGTTSVSLGSKWSSRQLKVYDRRGTHRLEFKTMSSRSNLIANELFLADPLQWPTIAKGHLRDFIDFKDFDGLLPWWSDFISNIPRAGKKLVNSRKRELHRKENWILTQVAPTLSVLVDINGRQYLDVIYRVGKRNRGKRYDAILGAHGMLKEE